jgi:hypothetical protein
MPSLASEESPTAGGKVAQNQNFEGARNMPPPNTTERAAVNALQSSEKTAVNALLMAAMAMTGLSGTDNDYCKEQNGEATTPPTKNGQQDDGTPEQTNRTESEFETPQKNLLGKFMSPKRKHGAEILEDHKEMGEDQSDSEARNGDDVDDDEDSPKREHPGDRTPAIEQKAKRTRLGSTRKGTGTTQAKGTKTMGSPMEMATPAKGTGGTLPDLTPVSARCIDFQKMRVHDSTSDPAVADSPSKQS